MLNLLHPALFAECCRTMNIPLQRRIKYSISLDVLLMCLDPTGLFIAHGVIPHQSFVPYNGWNLVHPEILVALKPHIVSPPLIFFCSRGGPHVHCPWGCGGPTRWSQFRHCSRTVHRWETQGCTKVTRGTDKSNLGCPRYTCRHGISNYLVLWGWYQKPLYSRIPSKLYI